MGISCIAVIGKDNYPLFINTNTEADSLFIQYNIHSALDMVQEKFAKFASADTKDMFLGLLYPTEDHRIYGYITNTKVKFIIMVEVNSHILIRDIEINDIFRKLHAAYVEMLFSPFYTLNTPIKSLRFKAIVTELMYNSDK